MCDLSQIDCDPYRIKQVFTNLFENTLRYTDAPGQLHISSKTNTKSIELILQDSAPSVPDASLKHLFDRLYRVDPSRNRETGASGLGLSICKAIVVAHSGSIHAQKSSLGGLAIHLTLPIKQT